MRTPASVQVLRTDLQAHPAAQAWGRLNPDRREPATIEVLQQRNKSAIYRLTGVGPHGGAVIAKCCESGAAQAEGRIYEHVLPRLPIVRLQYFGMAGDPGKSLAWLFVEDAGEEAYTPERPEHCAVGARWLARLHTSGAELPEATCLPERGPAYYLEQLRLARRNLVNAFANPLAPGFDLVVLDRILAQCDHLEARWGQVERLCQGAQPTLIHGDLKTKNLRIRKTGRGLEMMVFDWEFSGWGIAAADLAKCPSLPLYWSEVRGYWPNLQLCDVEALARVGQLFRSLAALQWESTRLQFQWLEWPLMRLSGYYDRLLAALRGIGLN